MDGMILSYFFTVAKQGFLGNFETGSFLKNLSEGYLSEITLPIL